MADSPSPEHSGSSADDSAASPPAEWCAEQWSVLCDVLDVSDPTEVVPQVRALADNAPGSTPDPTRVKETFEEMHDQLESLWERNAELLDRLDSSPDAAAPSPAADALHPETEALLNHLDAASPAEAQERVESLKEQIDHLYHEKEQLAEAGLMSADEALDEINRLQKQCDQLHAQQDATASSPDAFPDVLQHLHLDTPEAAEMAAAQAAEADAALAEAAQKIGVTAAASVPTPDAFDDTLRALNKRATALRDHAGAVEASAEVADVLGLESADEAQELEQIVRRMSTTLEALHTERGELMDELGIAHADDVLDLVRSLEHQLSEFYELKDQASGEQLAGAIEEVLGISSVDEARELEALVHRMNERLEAAAAEHKQLADAGYDPQTALATIDSMEEQLVSLYREREEMREASDTSSLEAAVAEVLGLTTPAEVEQMNRSVRRLTEQVDALRAEHQALLDADLTARDALLMLENMSKQLSSLYEDHDELRRTLTEQIDVLCTTLGLDRPEAPPEAALAALQDDVRTLLSTARVPLPDHEAPANLADALQALADRVPSFGDGPPAAADTDSILDILGISSVQEARDLATVVENMSEQLDALYADRAQLHELGLSSVESAVEMIESMSAQLDELYEEEEWLQGRSSPATEQQDTFEQLATLYSEQEKLERSLGVSEADDVIEMVEALAAQLEALYSNRKDEPRPHVPAAAPEASSLDAAPLSPAAEAKNRSARLEHVFSSMRDQLEALYEEKEALLNLGLNDARQAAQRIDELKARLSTLQHEHQQCRGRLEQLQDTLGTTNVDEIVGMVEAVPDVFGEGESPSPSEANRDITSIDDGPALLPDGLQDPLDALSKPELDDLSVGVLRLDDDGTIEYLNEAALALPGLRTAGARSEWLGEFLFQVVPSTSSTLFLNRFRTGVENESMDARFPYTFVSAQHTPAAFFVHLYREGPDGANWLLLRPAG